jgi:homoserine O-acetyltransferase
MNARRSRVLTACCLLLGMMSPATGASPERPAHAEGDVVANDFHFASGELLPELRIHFTALGTAHRNAQGHVDNAVLILHGTGGSGRNFLTDKFAGVLFGKGQPLDASRFYIILPDGIGHGTSSRPSDGLHARFPHYDYTDMVQAQYLLLADLRVDHLRLVLGTSMGCMQAWLWGEQHPEFVDALMPLACLPVPIAGRNRVWRTLLIQAIRSDPEWLQGEYKAEPTAALRTAAGLILIAGSAPIQMQRVLPTRAAADEFVTGYVERELAALDANDLLYQVEASGDYDPSGGLDQIRAPVMWVNSADDFINPPELGIAEREAKRLKNGHFVLLPASDQTHGHGTHTWAAVWRQYLEQLLAAPPPPPAAGSTP